jgi:O-antigen/teichoic acid export membrane protein
LLGRTTIAFVDQALKSAVGFAIAIVLIKFMGKQEYGYYSLAFPVSLFLIALQNAVVTTPMTVLLARKRGARKKAYVRALCWGQLGILMPAAMAGLAIVVTLGLLGLDMRSLHLAAALCAASSGLLLHQFLRAYYFAEERPATVLKLDLLQLGIFGALMAVALRLHAATAAIVFLFSGLSGIVAFACFRRRALYPAWEGEPLRNSYAENWRHGRWALLGVISMHIQTYSSTYMLGALAGSLAVADLSASRLLLMPFMLVRQGWAQVSVPHGSRLRQAGRMTAYFRELAIACITGPALVAVYAAILLQLAPFLEGLLFTDKFDRAFDLIPLWAAVASAQFIRMNASFGLQVLTRFRLLAYVNIVMMGFTVIVAYALIHRYGIAGALVAMLLGEGIMAAILWGALVYRTLIHPLPPERRT